MKTRIIYPQLWHDSKFCECSVEAKTLFMFIITNPYLGLSRYSRLSDRQIAFHTGLSGKKLENAKNELSTLKWCFFSDEWVYHNHDCAYIDYTGNEKVSVSKEQEIQNVPEKIKEVIKGLVTGYQPNINNKSEIINQKGKGDARGKTIDEAASQSAVEVLKRHNLNYGTNFTSARSIMSNLKYWLEVYKLEQILEADDNIKYHEFWNGKMTPDILLRRKNTKGEDVDYIGQLLNAVKKPDQKPVRLGYKALMERTYATTE